MSSSSPFDIFRRNLKPMMVLLTALAMFAFIVLPVLDTYMRRSSGAGGDEVVAEFDGRRITRRRVDSFTQNHQSTVRFLYELAEATMARGGMPQTAGFQYDNNAKQISALGINSQPSPQATIRTLQFSEKASSAGFALDDIAIETWLEQFTNGRLDKREINGLLMQITRNRMGQPHLYEQLRHQLLADLYQRGALTSLVDGRMPLLTPAEQWDTFVKLNRKATVNTYGVLVADYIAQTNDSPSETEILAVYDKGKDRDADDQSGAPAFHKRYAAKFEYLVGDFQNFLDAEIEKLSEEELREEYQRRLAGGEFKMPDRKTTDFLNSLDSPTGESEMPAGSGEESDPPADEPTDQPGDDSGDEAPAEPAVEEKPTADGEPAEPAAETTEESSESDSEPATDNSQPAEEDSSENAEDSPAEPAEEAPVAGDEPDSDDAADTPADEDQSRNAADRSTTLVALQNEEAAESQGSENDAKAAADSPAEEAAPQDPKEEPNSTEESTADSAETPEPDGDQPASEEAQPTESPADDSAPEKTDAGDAGQESTESPAEPEEPEVKPFEDVRDDIARELANPEARRKMDAAVTEITTQMRLYFEKRSIYETNVTIGNAGDPPAMPDLKALADKSGFKYEPPIGPYDEITIADEPISRSFELGSGLSRGLAFRYMMFGVPGPQGPDTNRRPLFQPLRTADDQADRIYVSWKVEEREAYTPPLDEVRGEVVQAIRMREARKLALAEAEKLAKQAAEADAPLADVVPEGKTDNLREQLQPFSWLQMIGLQGATIGNVGELDSVGPKFMEAAFGQDVGGIGVAFNQPERVIYLIQPQRFEPSMDELKRQFKQPTNRMMALFVGGTDADEIIQGFYEASDEKSGFASQVTNQ